MAQINNIAVYRGEDVSLNFTMTPTTDITGWHMTFTLRNNANDAAYIIQSTTAITNPASAGQFSVSLTHAQTVVLLGRYAYDVQRTDANSDAVLSIGNFDVLQEVLYP